MSGSQKLPSIYRKQELYRRYRSYWILDYSTCLICIYLLVPYWVLQQVISYYTSQQQVTATVPHLILYLYQSHYYIVGGPTSTLYSVLGHYPASDNLATTQSCQQDTPIYPLPRLIYDTCERRALALQRATEKFKTSIYWTIVAISEVSKLHFDGTSKSFREDTRAYVRERR